MDFDPEKIDVEYFELLAEREQARRDASKTADETMREIESDYEAAFSELLELFHQNGYAIPAYFIRGTNTSSEGFVSYDKAEEDLLFAESDQTPEDDKNDEFFYALSCLISAKTMLPITEPDHPAAVDRRDKAVSEILISDNFSLEEKYVFISTTNEYLLGITPLEPSATINSDFAQKTREAEARDQQIAQRNREVEEDYAAIIDERLAELIGHHDDMHRLRSSLLHSAEHLVILTERSDSREITHDDLQETLQRFGLAKLSEAFGLSHDDMTITLMRLKASLKRAGYKAPRF